MIFDGNLRIAADAARRWHERQEQRARRQGMSVADVETPKRI